MGALLEGEGISTQPLALLGSPLVYRRKGELVEGCWITKTKEAGASETVTTAKGPSVSLGS